MNGLLANLKITAIAAGVIAAATLPGLAASKKKPAKYPAPAVQTAPPVSGGAYGKWFFSDGSQQWLGRTVAGAAPNIIATGAGVRCSFVLPGAKRPAREIRVLRIGQRLRRARAAVGIGARPERPANDNA